MRDEDDFLRAKGVEVYTLAPGVEAVPQDILTDLAGKLRQMEVTGKVSRDDVAPYIDKFPVTVGLDDFDEQPSSRNYSMAMESMAAFLKMGLALALIGAIGFVVYSLLTSRSKCKNISTEDGWRAYLFQSISKARGALLNSPAWLNPGMVGADGLNLANAIDTYLRENTTRSVELEKEGMRLFSRIQYDNLQSFSRTAPLTQHVDSLSQGKALVELRKLLDGAGERIQHGNAYEVLGDIREISRLQPVDRFTSELIGLFPHILPRKDRKPGQTDGAYLLDITEQLETFYGEIETETDTASETLARSIKSLGAGFPLLPTGTNELSGDITFAENTFKTAGAASEKLKGDARTFKLSTEVETAAGEAIEEINQITKAALRLFDISSAEVTSAYRHARWLAGVHVDIMGLAENILKHNGESAKATKLSDIRKDLERDIKKSN